MILQILGTGLTSYDNFPHILHLISSCLEAEWEDASREIANGVEDSNRIGKRQERHLFTVKACTVLQFLLHIQPTIPNLYENFAHSCGDVQGGAAWILSAMVNSYSDEIRSIGVRCLVAYLQRTAKSPDSPLSLDGRVVTGMDKTDSGSTTSNTLALISNVGQGLLMSNVTQKLAAMGPIVKTPSKLTAAVVYKLLWHLLKSHRYRLGSKTQSSLIRMVFEDKNASFHNFKYLRDKFLTVDDILGDGVMLDIAWAEGVFGDTRIGTDTPIRDSLSTGTIMRLLRFLPGEFTDQWLSILVSLASTSQDEVGKLCDYPDWQPCLFQLISEVLEQMTKCVSISRATQNTESEGAPVEEALVVDSSVENGVFSVKDLKSPKDIGPTITNEVRNTSAQLSERFDLSVELYSILLGHSIREDSGKVIAIVTSAAIHERYIV